MKNQEQLINNAIGQLEGIKKMLANKQDCFKIINQMKAVHSAVANVMERFVEENFIQCSNEYNKQDKNKLQKLFKEILKK